MIFFCGLALISVLGLGAIGGLVAIVRADLRAQDDAPVLNTDESAESGDDYLTLIDSNLVLALSRLRAQGEEIPSDAFLHTFARGLTLTPLKWSTASLPVVFDPARLQEAARRPLEELELTVRAYNRLKRLGVHDLGGLLVTPTRLVAGSEPGLRNVALEEVQSRVAAALAEAWPSTPPVVTTSQIVEHGSSETSERTFVVQVSQGGDRRYSIRVHRGSRTWVLEEAVDSREAAVRVAEDFASVIEGASGGQP